MSPKNGLLGLVVAVAGFLVVGVVVTELVAKRIEFSLFVGLPVGLIGGLVLGWLTVRWLASDLPERRHRGMGLAGFGVVFLITTLVSTIAVGMRNSRALPLAGGIGLAASVFVYGWYRRQAPDERSLEGG